MAKRLIIKSDIKAYQIPVTANDSNEGFLGLNNNDDSTQIGNNQAQDLLNVISTKEITKRGGFAKVNSVALTGSTGIFGLGTYYKTGGSAYLMLASHTTIQSIHTGTGAFTELITGLVTNERTRFKQFKNIVVITKASDVPYKYSGGGAGTGAVLDGEPPTCPYQVVFKNYHFLAGNATYPSRLYYSKLDDNETWGGTDFVDVYPDDGDIIVGLEVTFDSLIIFKEYGIYILTGDCPTYTEGLTLWRIDKASTDTGSVAQGSITSVGRNLIYISRNNGIQTFGGTMVTSEGTEVSNISSALLSKDVTPTIKGLSTTRLNQAEAINWDYKYMCSVPNGSSTTNNLNLVYDYAKAGWYIWNIPANCWTIFRTSGADDLYFGSPSTGFIYKYTPDTYSDAGVAINAYYKTKDFNLGSSSNNKIFRKFYVTVNKSQDFALTVEPTIDMVSTVAGTYTIAAQASDSLWGTLVWGTDKWGAATTTPSAKQIMNSRGKFINYKFSNNILNETMRLRDLTQYYRMRGAR